MAYDKEKIFKQAKEQIKENNLFFVQDIVAFVPCSRSTFYELFPDGSDELDTFKELLESNKVVTKSSIRAKLWKSNKAAELLALYRLIATTEEHQKLNQSYIDHTSKGKQISLNDMSTDEIRRLLGDDE